jgi:peptidoglycan hydrolase-like protein with peptidoglycan-binding domain
VGAQTDSAQPDAGALRLGMRGPEVGRLQDELILLGYLTLAQKLSGPGVFGPKTQTALMGFQRDNHLAVNGIHDAPTRSAIDQLRAGISRNQIKNPVVEGMQNRLVALGFMTSDEVARGPGFFGPKTEAALKAFQAKRGMEPNGILTYTAYQVLYATGG